MRTPPGISPSVFGAALQEFASVVGARWVFSSEEDLDLYRDAYSPLRGQPGERIASAAVAPASVEEVQAIVRIANRLGIPLYTISTGKNLGYGGSAPAYSGSVVLDLKRMNRIIEVNDSNHYAIVEPGVSYFDLYHYIQERGLKVWVDVPDPGWGSLIGNALEHGVGHTASRYRNHFDAHCGMEVVLADGELVRTGMGALPNASTWGQFKMGFGPILDGMFSQSNFGIVTKMGFWLMPQPEAFLQASILAPRYEDLHPLVELLKFLENSGIAQGMPQLGSPLLGLGGDTKSMVDVFLHGPPSLAAEHQRLIADARLGHSTALERYGQEHGIAYWKLMVTYYGPAKVVAAQWEATQDIASKSIKNARFTQAAPKFDPQSEAREANIYAQDVGIPNLEFFALGTRAGGNPHPMAGHMFFSPVIPQSAEAIFEFNRVMDDASRALPVLQSVPIMNFKPFTLPAGFFERAFFMVLGFPITDNQELNNACVQAFRELIKVGAEHRWGEYRTPPIFYDEVMHIYSFNQHRLLRLHERIKDAVDPKGILSPGRFGIWPQHLREKQP